MERSAGRFPVEDARPRERSICGDMHPGFQLAIALGDAFEARGDKRFGFHASPMSGTSPPSGIGASATFRIVKIIT